MHRISSQKTHLSGVRAIWLYGLSALAAGVPAARAAHDGAKLYDRYCAACHGGSGEGGVGVPLALPDFLATVNVRMLSLRGAEGDEAISMGEARRHVRQGDGDYHGREKRGLAMTALAYVKCL